MQSQQKMNYGEHLEDSPEPLRRAIAAFNSRMKERQVLASPLTRDSVFETVRRRIVPTQHSTSQNLNPSPPSPTSSLSFAQNHRSSPDPSTLTQPNTPTPASPSQNYEGSGVARDEQQDSGREFGGGYDDDDMLDNDERTQEWRNPLDEDDDEEVSDQQSEGSLEGGSAEANPRGSEEEMDLDEEEEESDLDEDEEPGEELIPPVIVRGRTYLRQNKDGQFLDPDLERFKAALAIEEGDDNDADRPTSSQEGNPGDANPERGDSEGPEIPRERSPSPVPPAASPLPRPLPPPQPLADRTTYRPPPKPSVLERPPPLRKLTKEEDLSLTARFQTLANNSNQKSYQDNIDLHKHKHGIDLLSLHDVDKLARELSEVEERRIDVCPRGCMAYLGPHSDKEYCDQMRWITEVNSDGTPVMTNNGKGKTVKKRLTMCGVSRYQRGGKKKASLSIPYFGLISRMRVLFRDAKIAEGLRSLGKEFKEAVASRASGSRHPKAYNDFGHGKHLATLSKRYPELFEDERTSFFNISTDGAILKLGRSGDFWSIEASITNLPIEMGRYQRAFQWTLMLIPCELPPVDLESYFYAHLEELDRAAMGYWFWDGSRQEWFLWRGAWLLLLADQMGMLKVSGMNGSRGHLPCWFCLMIRCHSSAAKTGSYCPLHTVPLVVKVKDEEVDLNSERPVKYDPHNLPMRTLASLEKTKNDFAAADNNPRKVAQISRDSGVSKITLYQTTPLYLHPSSTPSDIAHLAFEDTGKNYWSEIFVKGGHVSSSGLDRIGEMYDTAYVGLPSKICSGKPRSIKDYFNTSFKMWEMALWILWFSIPMLAEAEVEPVVLATWAKYVLLITKVLDRSDLTPERVEEIKNLAASHQVEFEDVFIRLDPAKVSLLVPSFHFLLHLWHNIVWHGHLSLYSQFPMERKLGWLKRLVRQWTNAYRTLEFELRRHIHRDFVLFLYPELLLPEKKPAPKKIWEFGVKIAIGGLNPIRGDEYWRVQGKLLEAWFKGNTFKVSGLSAPRIMHHFGTVQLPGGAILRSLRLFRHKKVDARQSYHFLGQEPGGPLYYGKVISFLQISLPSGHLSVPPSTTQPSSPVSPPSSHSPPNVSVYKLAFVQRTENLKYHFDSSSDSALVNGKLAPYVDSGSFEFDLIPVEHIRELVGVMVAPRQARTYILRSNSQISEYIPVKVGDKDDDDDDNKDNSNDGDLGLGFM